MRYQITVFCFLIGCTPAQLEREPDKLPVIDVHLHTVSGTFYGNPPPIETPPGVEWASTNEGVYQGTIQALDRNNVVLAVASGPLDLMQDWQREMSVRLIPGALAVSQPCEEYVQELEPLYESGDLEVLGEVGWQFAGLSPSDPAVEPCLAMVERLDVPIGIHMGLGVPGAVSRGASYRPSLGNPLLLEEALARHPNLRLWVMHAGWPMGDEMIALMHQFPSVYVDLSLINWFIPRAEFHDYLQRLINAGLGKRLMFGSDQGVWPRAIDVGIEAIKTASFLTDEQERDILYNNAVQFYRLEATLEQ